MSLICALLVLFFLNFLVELWNKLRAVKNQENCKFLVDPSHKQDEYMSKACSVSLNKASTALRSGADARKAPKPMHHGYAMAKPKLNLFKKSLERKFKFSSR